MELPCPLGTTRCIPQEKFPLKPYNKSFIDQAYSVKMAAYWPGSFFFEFMDRDFVSIHKHAKKELGQYPAILTEQARSIKDLLYGFQGNFSCGIQRVVPSGQNSYIFPSREANHSARFGTSCLLTKTSHIIFIKVIKSLCHFLSLSLCR